MAPRLFSLYADTPDGTDCHRKTYASTAIGGSADVILMLMKRTGWAGLGSCLGYCLVASAYSVALNPADSALEAVARIGRYTFTAAAIGAVFGLTTCVSAQVREKPDDPLNYFIGGCAGGLTLGARTHSYGTAAVGCVAMGTAAALSKIGQLEGWELFPKPSV